MHRRRFSKPQVETLGKVLTFDWELFMTDSHTRPLRKSDLRYEQDYLIQTGNYSGKIARFVQKDEVKQFGTFKTTRGNQIRVRCDKPKFASIPRLGCWMEPISNSKPVYDRPPMLLIQAKSICGAPPQDEINCALREGNQLIAHWRYRKNVTAESIDVPRLESTLCKLANDKHGAHSNLKQLVYKGFFVCYEDDGWLIKCTPQSKLRFMRRSHMIQITICRCGNDVCNAMFDDFTLRTLLPSRYFGGLIGKKPEPSKLGAHMRRSSSFAGDLGFSLDELLNEFDKSQCYARIFQRFGSVDGNLLIKDSLFMDGVRSFVAHGGYARKVIVPNFSDWRRMIKVCTEGEGEYLLMGDVRIVNGQWTDVMKVLPNNRCRAHSFSCVYYDGTVEINENRMKHKVVKEVHPKQDIALVFEKHILMNGAYLVITLSRRGVDDNDLASLFDNVNDFVANAATKFGYNVKRVALGIYRDHMIYCDFQVWIKPKRIQAKKRIRHKVIEKAKEKADARAAAQATTVGKRLSKMGLDPTKYEFFNKKYEENDAYFEDRDVFTSDRKENKLYEYYRKDARGNRKSEVFVNSTDFQHFTSKMLSRDSEDDDDSDSDDSNNDNIDEDSPKYVKRYMKPYQESKTKGKNKSKQKEVLVKRYVNYYTDETNGNTKMNSSNTNSNSNSNTNTPTDQKNHNNFYEYYRSNARGNRKSDYLVNNPNVGKYFSSKIIEEEKYDSTSNDDDDDDDDVEEENNNGHYTYQGVRNGNNGNTNQNGNSNGYRNTSQTNQGYHGPYDYDPYYSDEEYSNVTTTKNSYQYSQTYR